MPLDQLLPLVALAFAGSFTPGPNNTIATLTAANHGFRAVLPHLVGVPFGFATMLLAGATGIAAVLLARPMVAQAIKWAGVAYLLLIALQIARAGSPGERSSVRPLTFWQSVAFQYANPKGWMLAVATAGSFMTIRPTAATTAVDRRRVGGCRTRESRAVGERRQRTAYVPRRGSAPPALQPRDGPAPRWHGSVAGGDPRRLLRRCGSISPTKPS